MLRGIRTASSNWLGKIVMGVVVAFLVVSFAIWGIGDIFRGFGLSKVATIGSTEISIEQFQRAYTERVQQLGRQTGRPVTNEQARAIGLDRQVLGEMVAEAALDERIRQLGLGITDEQVAHLITTNPNFAGLTGQFDRAQFEQIIRSAGYTESRFVNEQRRLVLRRQLADTIAGNLVVPQAEIEAVNRYQNEQRAIDYIVLDRPQAGAVPEPTAEQLQQYFDEHRALFRAPELRTAVLVTLSPEEIGRWLTIPDAELRKAYEQQQARYRTPERRRVRQIVFPSEEEARAAAARIAAGTSFEAIAAERKLQPQDVDLGLVSKSQIIDPAIAEAAFALAPNTVSAPVKGRFGVALVQVLSVEPEKVRSFEEAAPEIRQALAIERGRNELANLRDKIEDERAAGATLEEVAKKFALQTRTVEIDRSGRTPDGVQLQLPAAQQLIPAIFATGLGIEAEPVQVGEGGLIYFEVTRIMPSRERPFEEVREDVAVRWRDEQIAAALQAKAAEFVEKVKAGAALQALAAAQGLELRSATGLTRIRAAEDIPASVIEAVFRTPDGGVGTAEGDPPRRVVFRVTSVTVPVLDLAAAETQRLIEALRRSLADAMLTEYLARLEADIGTRINQAALNQAIGGGSQ